MDTFHLCRSTMWVTSCKIYECVCWCSFNTLLLFVGFS